jgi:hypothetical protein
MAQAVGTVTMQFSGPVSMLVGIVTSRRIIGVPVLVAADTEKLVAIVAPAI